MPRHGSADATGDVDVVDPGPRGSGLAQWSVRSKLLLLAMIPLVALLAGGAVLVVSMGQDYRRARQAREYADALIPAVTFSANMNAEFNGADLSATQLGGRRDRTDTQAAQLRTRLAAIDDSSETSGDIDRVTAVLNGLRNARARYDELIANNTADPGSIGIQMQNVTDSWNDALQNLVVRLAAQIGTDSPNRSVTDGSTVAASVHQAMVSASNEQQTIRSLLTSKTEIGPSWARRLADLAAQQDVAFSNTTALISPADRPAWTAVLDQNTTLNNWRTSLAQQGSTTNQVSVGAWDSFATARTGTIANLMEQVATNVSDNASATERGTLLRGGGVAAVALTMLLVVTFLLAVIARSVTVPLRRLRAGAVEIASVQLPAAVSRIEQDGVAADISLPPVLPADISAGPETYEVARAVDDLGAEAVRLATAQVRLRRALDEAFVSMSRRSQSMVEKQLGIIDELESQEQDPDQLRNLFRLDHLAARMRRYNDNLLVLAGSAVRTRATAPVKVAELFRAATSEMEQYERVRLQPVSGASVAGTVTGELVHLLAELLDNAAMYSPPSSSIGLSAAFTADGGLQIEVVDGGVGISPGEIDRLNARLTQPEAIDTQVPSRMGLFVVARLARRGTFDVLLQQRADAAGTLALVRVPPNLVIGAPGNTGEAPALPVGAQVRTPTPDAGLPSARVLGETARPPAVQARAAVARAASQPQTLPQGTAAATAANVRSITGEGGSLPRRRRGSAVSTSGRPVTDTTLPGDPNATGLFTPAVPAEDGEARTGSLPTASAIARLGLNRGETSPTGIPSLRPPDRDGRDGTPPPDAATPSAPAATPAAQAATPAAPAALDGRSAPADPNPVLPEGSRSNGAAPAAWDPQLPSELAARAATAANFRPSEPPPLIGETPAARDDDPTPIFDQISVWFTAEPTGGITIGPEQLTEGGQVIDLRETAPRQPRQPSSRWAALGDQRWLATSAQAAAAPVAEGTTEQGLPKRRPGANLLPSANGVAAQPAQAPVVPGGVPIAPTGAGFEPASPEPDQIRGRLGSYQRGLADARRNRTTAAPEPTFDPVGASLFTASAEPGGPGGAGGSGGEAQDNSNEAGGAH